MSGFFYTTGAGAMDALALAAICIFGLAAGAPATRLLSAAMAVSFLLERTAMALIPEPGLYLAFISVQFFAMLFVLFAVPGRLALPFASLQYGNCAISILPLAGAMSFVTSATLVTVAFYLQLLIILAGGLDGLGLRRSRSDRGLRTLSPDQGLPPIRERRP
jgi:hypothetical protein